VGGSRLLLVLFSLMARSSYGEVGLQMKCQFFLWLAFHNRSWTADRLAKRGLPHPSCVLCDQEEHIQHIIIEYVFSG
jgi:hypothetical protein